MPRFHYRAIDGKGEAISGAIDAADEWSAAARLQAEGATPISVQSRRAGGLRELLDLEITPKDALGAKDRAVFTRVLATLLGAGLPLDRALEILSQRGERRAARAVAARLLEAVKSGDGLAAALDRHPAGFPPLYRSVVRAGEAGAALDATLARLADGLEEADRRRGEIRSALIYPAFLLFTSLLSVVVLMTFVVPTFEPMLKDAGVEPPAATAAVIAAGRLFTDYGWLAAAGALGAAVAFALALRRTAFRARWHRLTLRLPIFGRLAAKAETGRLARLLGMLLQNGVALTAALPLVRDALGNAAFAAEIDRIAPEVAAGRGLAEPLAQGGIAPPLALQLIQVGEESGRLTEMLFKTAEIFEEETKRDVDQALSLLTPSLILFMGALVALIVSSILFALFSINELAV